MASAIDPTKPVDGLPAVKADLRQSLQAAKSEIETLQVGKADTEHFHANFAGATTTGLFPILAARVDAFCGMTPAGRSPPMP